MGVALLLLVGLLVLAGCGVHGSVKSEVETSDPIRKGKTIRLVVSVPRAANAAKASEAVSRLLEGNLIGSGLARRVVTTNSASNYTLLVELMDIKVSWRGGKLVFGAFVGRQGITARVTMVDRSNNREIRKAVVSGSAPADPQNPDEALEGAARGLAQEVVAYLSK